MNESLCIKTRTSSESETNEHQVGPFPIQFGGLQEVACPSETGLRNLTEDVQDLTTQSTNIIQIAQGFSFFNWFMHPRTSWNARTIVLGSPFREPFKNTVEQVCFFPFLKDGWFYIRFAHLRSVSKKNAAGRSKCLLGLLNLIRIWKVNTAAFQNPISLTPWNQKPAVHAVPFYVNVKEITYACVPSIIFKIICQDSLYNISVTLCLEETGFVSCRF